MDAIQIAAQAVPMLARWAQAVERYWTELDDPARSGSSTGCYGPGYIHWGIQSNWNYSATMATLAAQPGVERADHWRDRALGALRFALSTHLSGDHHGLNGEHWGHSWISMLGIERAMHGVALLEPHLSADDRAALRRVLCSEADWLLYHGHRGGHHGVIAGRWNSSGRNAPESNIWAGTLLWRAAQRYPNEPHAGEWAERAHKYLFNGFCRRIQTANGQLLLASPPEKDMMIDLDSRWANVDDALGVVALYGGEGLRVDRSARRRGGRYDSLYVDEICLQVETGPIRRKPGETLIDVGFAVLSNTDANDTAALTGGPLDLGLTDVRGTWIASANGPRYALVANFGEEPTIISALEHQLELDPGQAHLVEPA